MASYSKLINLTRIDMLLLAKRIVANSVSRSQDLRKTLFQLLSFIENGCMWIRILFELTPQNEGNQRSYIIKGKTRVKATPCFNIFEPYSCSPATHYKNKQSQSVIYTIFVLLL